MEWESGWDGLLEALKPEEVEDNGVPVVKSRGTDWADKSFESDRDSSSSERRI